jgi:hypothetical protein
MKGFWKKYDKTVPGWELFVDAENGDIVVHFPEEISSDKKYPPVPEIYYRFKRIGK